MLPWGLIRNEMRWIPRNSLPINFLGAQMPYDWQTLVSVSANNGNGRLCFWANFAWLLVLSLLIPKTVTPACL